MSSPVKKKSIKQFKAKNTWFNRMRGRIYSYDSRFRAARRVLFSNHDFVYVDEGLFVGKFDMGSLLNIANKFNNGINLTINEANEGSGIKKERSNKDTTSKASQAEHDFSAMLDNMLNQRKNN